MRWAGIVLLLAATARAEGLAGRWTVDVVRQGWNDAEGRGTLLVERTKEEWLGTLHLPRLFEGAPQPLFDFRVEGGTFRFRLDHPTLKVRFDGKVEADRIRGVCVWGEGLHDWRAVRRRVVRFDEETGSARKIPRVAPAAAGFHAPSLDTLIEAEQWRGTGVLLVARHGKLVCERHFKGQQRRVALGRATPFLVGLAAAMLVEEGKITSADQPLSRWYPEWKSRTKAGVRLVHLLTHASGIDPEPDLVSARDRLQAARRAKIGVQPGTVVRRSDAAAMLVGGVIQRAARQRVDLYLDRKVFAPLDVWDWQWEQDEAKNTLAYTGLALPARDLARIGIMLAGEGKWRKKAVVPPRALYRASRPAHEAGPGRGFFWRLRTRPAAAWYQAGVRGQGLAVYPDLGIVALRFDVDGEVEKDTFESFLARLEKTVLR